MLYLDTINERIALIIADQCGGNRSEFARKLGITPGYAAQLHSGARVPGDRMIADICREFHVRREWLENGEEPMKYPEADESLRYIDELMADDPGPFASLIRAALIAYCEADPADRPALDRFAENFLKNK